MLAHAQALREQFVKPWDLTPMYLRKPDAEINWSTRETGVMAARADDLQPRPGRARRRRSMPMRRRHLRAVLRIEGQAEHRGWSLGLFMGELANERGRRYLVAKVGGAVVGFAGMLFLGPDGHVTTIVGRPGLAAATASAPG